MPNAGNHFCGRKKLSLSGEQRSASSGIFYFPPNLPKQLMVALVTQLNRGGMECVDVRAPHPGLVGVGWRMSGTPQIRNIQRKVYRWLVWKQDRDLSSLDVNLGISWRMGHSLIHARESFKGLLNCSLTFCRNWALIFCSAASAST